MASLRPGRMVRESGEWVGIVAYATAVFDGSVAWPSASVVAAGPDLAAVPAQRRDGRPRDRGPCVAVDDGDLESRRG